MKYAIVYSPPSGYWMLDPALERRLAQLPDVIAVRCSRYYSLQPEFIQDLTERPLTVILWGTADRYDIGDQYGFSTVVAADYRDVEQYATGFVPREVTVYARDSEESDWTYIKWVERESSNP